MKRKFKSRNKFVAFLQLNKKIILMILIISLTLLIINILN